MVEITYNCASPHGKGWSSGSVRLASWADVADFIKQHLDEGHEILITSYEER